MKIKIKIVSSIIAIGLFGCVSTTPEGAKVKTTRNSERVEGCDLIDDIESSSNWGGFAATGAAHDNALAELKNKAAEIGGNIILFSNVSNTMGGTRMSGEVYKCK